ncbi:hypothetical protein vBAbaMPhT2_105 [Acinetobacter phage vB_AbaM_PhT2]|uniref:Uncharacterized protein n=2 Tax=Hadassahvirus TaxID=2842716 RepID=A0A6B9SXS8_9CAUD|nr:hypothetical protein HYP74_gp120 [Acinetobacter phage AbTZA1]YP_009887125.1 hypothetical protein HYQ24_gp105 [Acinetobacter phage vB_AbaM_PhT2]QQM13972.1 hypothetical protein CPT_Maestro_245 [Acinetobacter phage Maestro]QQM18725.1 hypothetical protein CPT_Morttis_239 [Acinetobacter phage Morttis]UQS94305.1 hypothetical protein ABNavy71_236 [Acinetobacter phage AB-Navy71]SSU39504.1 Uncharacterised protein [Acinetobacter baumannii]AZU98731.1 hypothetical protein [Acinetobacter phage AbTZA1]
MSIKLSKIVTVVDIKRRTTAKFFNSVRKGDQIRIEHNAGNHPYKSTSPRYTVTNMSTMEQLTINNASLLNGLDVFNFLESA